MSEGPIAPLVAASFHFVPALIWWIIAADLWRYRLTRHPTSHFFRIAPFVAICMALHFSLHMLIVLTPTQFEGRLPWLHGGIEVVIGIIVVASMATFRHMVFVLPVREEPPTRTWLGLHYGAGFLVALVGMIIALRWDDGPGAAGALGGAYMAVLGWLSLMQVYRYARSGAWSAGGLEVRGFDVVIGLVAVFTGGAVIFLMAAAATGDRDPLAGLGGLFFHTAFGVCLALPFIVRMLGPMVRVTVIAYSTLTVAAVLFLGVPILADHTQSPELRRLLRLGTVALLGAMLASRGAWLEAIFRRKVALFSRFTSHLAPLTDLIDRLVFRASPRVGLQRFLSTISPEAGVTECCRRAVRGVTRIMELRGAAILLFDGSAPVVEGRVGIDPLERIWSTTRADDLPERAFAGAELRELPLALKEALIEADVVGVFPIVSPRRRWGHLFISTGFLETATRDDNVETLQAFADQVALVIDGAELLARAIAVERTLAHAEKLAAIGELAARVAHEIRNPVTAARSLAQQLAREPGSAFHEEHTIILAELERVERQVAALLRLARREEFRFENVDLGELVRATAEQCRARLEAAAIALDLDALPGVVASADREKLRQVLVNLIENAVDALSSTAGERRLKCAVGRANGFGVVRVEDNGPGVSAEILPRIFDPFFSLKESGTGLGLAIVKRTIDAHGGRIVADNPPGEGMRLRIELPLRPRPEDRDGGTT